MKAKLIYSKVQCDTVQYSTVLYIIVYYNSVLKIDQIVLIKNHSRKGPDMLHASSPSSNDSTSQIKPEILLLYKHETPFCDKSSCLCCSTF